MRNAECGVRSVDQPTASLLLPGGVRFAKRPPKKNEIFLLHSEKHCGIKILPTKRGDRLISPNQT
jgi:hypothetical protein